ncbi:MAG: Orotidine 5-phosphate decarboxylase [Alphaproteobacteria bacterium]|nr:Orotidine 5-phosphate decarboxylase [Alphaproteobacteria bacterium]
MTANPVFVALDTTDPDYAHQLAERVRGSVGGLKLGLEFFNAHGPDGIKPFLEMGLPVFLDLKYHDIPNTVAGACRAAAGLGVSILNVHAQGGAAMMRAALDAVKSVSPSTKLIAVTMLTSLGDEDLPSVGLAPPVGDQVLRLASLTQQCGLDGVVCSAHEIARLRAELGPDFQLVVPGIRPKGADVGDQKRVMGPAEAMAAGATQLVIGRPITAAADPSLAAREIAQSLGISAS